MTRIQTWTNTEDGLTDLLQSLGGTRGFLLEHELTGHLPKVEEKDAQDALDVDLLAPDGKALGCLRISATDGEDANILECFPDQQSAQERETCLERLEQVEPLLLGRLLLLPGVGTQLADVLEDLRTPLEKVLLDIDQWSSWLEPARGAPPQTDQLLTMLAEAGVMRRQRSDMIREGIAIWQGGRTDHAVDSAITDLYGELRDLRSRLVEGNLPLVASVAAQFRRGMDFMDCMRTGVIGLSRALDAFEPSRGNQLSTYASWWIRHSIGRALANHRTPVRIPVHFHKKITSFIRTFRQNWEPGIDSMFLLEWVQHELGLSTDEIESILTVAEATLPTGRRWPGLAGAAPTEEALFDASANPFVAMQTAKTGDQADRLLKRMLEEFRTSVIPRNSISKCFLPGDPHCHSP